MILSRLTVKKALKSAILRLQQAKIASPELDAEVLLAFALKKPREYLYAHPEAELTARQGRIYGELIARRAKHEPVAYLTGHKEFFGLDFVVDSNVLIPRPETELMVEETLNIIKNYSHPSQPPLSKGRRKTLLIDIGTGSGCIPIAIVKNSGINAVAIDTSAKALAVAKQNAKQNGVDKKIKFLKGDLLKNSRFKIQDSRFIILTANLPYLPTSEWRGAMPDVKKYEPRLALDGGRDGLKYYRELLPQIKSMTQIYEIPIICLFEFCPEQKTALKKLVQRYFYPTHPPLIKGRRFSAEIKKDLAGRDRLLIINISPSP